MAGSNVHGGRLRTVGRWLSAHPTKRTGFNWVIWAVVLFVALAVASSPAKTKPTSDQGALPAASSSAAAPSSPPVITTAPSTHPASTHTTTHVPAPARSTAVAGHELVNANGAVLPDPARTPGATNPDVTQATIGSTICVSGWTKTIRPPSDYTTSLKEQQLASGYSHNGDTNIHDYEEDHLISLELGGSPTSVQNLWPEPYAGPAGAHTKDEIENRLRELVCSGALPLATAQHDIATNWYAAFQQYVATAPAPATTQAAPPPAPAPAPATTGAPPAQPQGCTTTSSGSCIRGGEFCPQSKYGQVGYDAAGDEYTCTGDAVHPHWE